MKHSAPVKITVAPLPSPAPPGFEVERLLLRARHYLVEEDLAKASAAIDELFALDPEVIGGLTLQGALFQAAGQSAEALQSFDAALDLCNSRRPNAPEPPFELLRLHSQALDQAAPLTEVVSNSPSFRRGDSDGDGVQNLSDAVHTLGYLFLGNPTTVLCAKAADADDTGKLNISDPVFLLSHLFLGSREPPAPFPECGAEATVDEAPSARVSEAVRPEPMGRFGRVVSRVRRDPSAPGRKTSESPEVTPPTRRPSPRVESGSGHLDGEDLPDLLAVGNQVQLPIRVLGEGGNAPRLLEQGGMLGDSTVLVAQA